jgi:hypothetical protein
MEGSKSREGRKGMKDRKGSKSREGRKGRDSSTIYIITMNGSFTHLTIVRIVTFIKL